MREKVSAAAGKGLPKVGKGWIYGVVNVLPEKRIWDYLTWKSGGTQAAASLGLGKALPSVKRILMALPGDAREFLIALSVVQSLFRELEDAVFFLLAGPREAPMLESTFGAERCFVRVVDEAHLYLGEKRFTVLREELRDFQPDISVNLRIHSHPLLHFLFRCSGAPVRVELASDAHWPFANITIRPAEPPNFLRHFLSVPRLWEAAGRFVPVRWTRIKPSPERFEQARSLLSDSGVPEKFVLFLWQNLPEDAQWSVLETIMADRDMNAQDVPLLVLAVSDPLLGSGGLSARVRDRFHCLETDSPGLVLGFLTFAVKVLAMNGPLLHFASLTDVPVEAYFETGDAPYDTSLLNPLFTVRYVDSGDFTRGVDRTTDS